MEEEIRHKLVTLNVTKTREEVDSRNSVKGGASFFEDAAAKFNDVNFVPESMALPDLHEDFSISQKLYLSVDEINAKDVKKRFTDCHGKLINVKNAWELATAANGDERAKLEKRSMNSRMETIDNATCILLHHTFSTYGSYPTKFSY
jgi:hypothetical protein